MTDTNPNTGAGTGARPDTARTDELLAILADSTRRRVLWQLSNAGMEPLHIDEFATSTSSTIELYHNHLPRLARAGYITWDAGSGLIDRGPAFRQRDVSRMLRAIVDAFGEEAVR